MRLKSILYILFYCKIRLLSLDVWTPNLWYHSCESKTQTGALVDMYAELKILCSECGAMNTLNVDPSTLVRARKYALIIVYDAARAPLEK